MLAKPTSIPLNVKRAAFRALAVSVRNYGTLFYGENKMTKITRATCKNIRTDLDVALAEVAKKHGLSARSLSGSFDDDTFTVRCEFATVGDDGSVNDKGANDFRRYAPQFGLPADALGQTFVSPKSGPMKIVGLKPRSPKFPVIAEDESGKRYKFTADSVKQLLGSAKKAPAKKTPAKKTPPSSPKGKPGNASGPYDFSAMIAEAEKFAKDDKPGKARKRLSAIRRLPNVPKTIIKRCDALSKKLAA